MRSTSASTSSSVAAISSWVITARQREIGAHGLGGTDPHAVDELLLVLTRRGQVLRDRHAQALFLEPVREIVEASLHLVVDERSSGTSSGTSAAAASKIFSRIAIDACTRAYMSRRVRTSSCSASTVSNSLTSLDPLVGELGEHLLLGVLHEHLERDFVAGALAEALGELVVELQDVAGALAVQLLVELGHDDARSPPRRGSRWR